MPDHFTPFLEEAEQKLAAVQSDLAGTEQSKPRALLVGRVQELLDRCRRLKTFGPDADRRAVAELIVEIAEIEKLAAGAPTCEHHPDRAGPRQWNGTPVCGDCYYRLTMGKPPRT